MACSPLCPLGFPRLSYPLFFQASLAGHVLEIIVLGLLQTLSKLQSTNTDITLHLRPSVPHFVYLADRNVVYTSEFAAFLQQQHTGTYHEKLSITKKLISLLQTQGLLQRMFLAV